MGVISECHNGGECGVAAEEGIDCGLIMMASTGRSTIE